MSMFSVTMKYLLVLSSSILAATLHLNIQECVSVDFMFINKRKIEFVLLNGNQSNDFTNNSGKRITKFNFT